MLLKYLLCYLCVFFILVYKPLLQKKGKLKFGKVNKLGQVQGCPTIHLSMYVYILIVCIQVLNN